MLGREQRVTLSQVGSASGGNLVRSKAKPGSLKDTQGEDAHLCFSNAHLPHPYSERVRWDSCSSGNLVNKHRAQSGFFKHP